jgi:hypothetical protein
MQLWGPVLGFRGSITRPKVHDFNARESRSGKCTSRKAKLNDTKYLNTNPQSHVVLSPSDYIYLLSCFQTPCGLMSMTLRLSARKQPHEHSSTVFNLEAPNQPTFGALICEPLHSRSLVCVIFVNAASLETSISELPRQETATIRAIAMALDMPRWSLQSNSRMRNREIVTSRPLWHPVQHRTWGRTSLWCPIAGKRTRNLRDKAQ